MITRKQFPWISLSLLLFAYLTFGKYLSSTTDSLRVLSLAVGWGFIMAVILMNPLSGFQRFLVSWFKSDTVAFTSLIAAAAFASIALTWFNLFAPIFMLLAAEALARIDLQTAEYTQIQACATLTITAWLGIGIGWIIGQTI